MKILSLGLLLVSLSSLAVGVKKVNLSKTKTVEVTLSEYVSSSCYKLDLKPVEGSNIDFAAKVIAEAPKRSVYYPAEYKTVTVYNLDLSLEKTLSSGKVTKVKEGTKVELIKEEEYRDESLPCEYSFRTISKKFSVEVPTKAEYITINYSKYSL